jgi:hypothetical protein
MTTAGSGSSRTIRIDFTLAGDDDARALRGALLAARASELSELQRRAGRLSLGYGSESARDSMDAETGGHRRRIELLDELLSALNAVIERPG